MTLTIARLRSLAASLSFATVLSATLMAGVTLSITLPLAGCADKSAETALTINKTIKITRGEYDAVHDAFLKRLNLGVEGEKEKEAALKNTLLQEQIKQMTFNKLIFTALLNQDAKALNVSVSDADLKSYKDKNLAQIGGSEALDKVLKSEGMTQAEFDQNLRDEILIKKYVEAKAQRENLPLTVSDADAQQFYNAHKAMFNQPESVRASHILFKALPNIIKQDALQKNPKATEADIAREVSRIQGEKKKPHRRPLPTC